MRRALPFGLCLLTAGCLPGPEVWVADGAGLAPGAADTLPGWYRFAEGPAADAAGNVYFSDLAAAKVYRWDAEADRVTVVRDDGVATNGLAVGPDGQLYACEPFKGRVVRIDAEGGTEVIAAGYGGAPFNSCNDLWVDPAGGIYVTDPKYSPGPRPQAEERVYYVRPDRAVVPVLEALVRPNGIVGSPDGARVYVVDDGRAQTWVFTRGADGALTEGRVLAPFGADGLTLDAAGRLYVVGETVRVFDPAGVKVAELDPPFRATNVTFGGPRGGSLIITGKWVVHRIIWPVEPAGPSPSDP